MAISFPGSKSNGQKFTAGNKSWTWNGSSWKGTTTTGGDATTFDSLDSSQFLRSDTSDVMSFNTTTGETLKFVNNTSGGQIQIGFQQNDTDGLHHRGYIRSRKSSAGGAAGIIEILPRQVGGGTSTAFTLEAGQDPKWGGNEVWHAGNDGSGSGLDADTVDGIQASSFLRSDASDTFTGSTLALGNYGSASMNLNFQVSQNGASNINFYDNNGTEGLFIHTENLTYGGKIHFGPRWNTDENAVTFHMLRSGAGGTHNGARVGIGTTSPSSSLHLYDSTGTSSTATGTTLLTLDNYVGSDLNQQKTFIDFRLFDDNTNETPQVRIGAEVGANTDANTQEMEGEGAFVVYTNDTSGSSGTATGLNERLRVSSNGNVGIDDNNPSEKLSIGGGSIRVQDVGQYIYFGTNASVKIGTVSGNSNDLYLGSADDLNMESNYIRFWRDGYYGSTEYGRLAFSDDSWLCTGGSSHYLGIGTTGPSERLHVSGNILATGNIIANSDISLKDNITPIPNALDKVLQIRGVTYNRNDIEDNPKHVGVIAQEVEKVLPEVVSQGEDGIKSVAYGNMVSLLIEAIKEQQEQIDMLKEKLESK